MSFQGPIENVEVDCFAVPPWGNRPFALRQFFGAVSLANVDEAIVAAVRY